MELFSLLEIQEKIYFGTCDGLIVASLMLPTPPLETTLKIKLHSDVIWLFSVYTKF